MAEWRRMIYQGEDLVDFYLISDEGQIQSAKTGKLRSFRRTSKGYIICGISLGSRDNKKTIRVHRAVAETFIPNPECKPEVNHLDGDKENNFVSNLEWATPLENTAHANRLGLTRRVHGEEHEDAKLTSEIVAYARSVYVPGDQVFGIRALAREFGVHYSTMRDAITGDRWTSV